jgi:hypothetical protein
MWNVMFQKRADELSPTFLGDGKKNRWGDEEMKRKARVSAKNRYGPCVSMVSGDCHAVGTAEPVALLGPCCHHSP